MWPRLWRWGRGRYLWDGRSVSCSLACEVQGKRTNQGGWTVYGLAMGGKDGVTHVLKCESFYLKRS